MKKILLLAVTIFCFLNIINAQAGQLDPSFGNHGVVKTNFGRAATYNIITVQKDGKIIASGSAWNGTVFEFVIVRYNTDGRLDSSFSSDGIITTGITTQYEDQPAFSIVLQNDGKIVAAKDNHLARYNNDGSLDNTFSGDGKQTTNISVSVVTIQSDSKIVAAGSENDINGYPAVVRYNIDGSADKTFGTNGKQIVVSPHNGAFRSVAMQKDGKIVLAGIYGDFENDPYAGSVLLSRLNGNGSIDNTFAYNGSVNPGGGTSCAVIVQSDGKIVVAGSGAPHDIARTFISRFNNNGSIDSSFHGYGQTEFDKNVNNTSVALDKDGKIVVLGTKLTRLNTNGSLDSSFNINADQKVDFEIKDIVIGNNKLYAAGGDTSGTIARYLLYNSNNKAPIVKITSPANNTVYAAPATIIIKAAASDSDGTIHSVKFYNGSTYLKTDFTSPYSYTLTDLPAGTYTITAKATDNTGAQTISAPVKVIVNKAPIVSITSPVNNASFTAPATITVNAAASDADGTIYSVKFYNGTTYLKAVFTSPYTYTISNLPAGTYSLTAKATDNNGAQTISSAVTVTVKAPNKAPTVSITSPANNTTYAAPANITINALAADEDGTIHSVKFYNGTTYLKAVFASPYTYTLSNLPAGTYSITAKATDNDGAETISAPVTVTVSNAAIVSSRPVNNKTAVSEEISLQLYPNPATNLVNIYSKGLQQDKPATISVISVSGVVMKTMQSSSAAQMQLDVSSLARGVYTVKIVSGDKVMFKQFVKL